MCLLLIAVDVVPRVPMLLLGNRDEFHARASAAAAPWSEDPRVVGGRDLRAGGSWLAVRDSGRFAAVTNLRTGVPATAPRSRGDLVRGFVLGHQSPLSWLERLRAESDEYGPFNLVVGDASGTFVFGGGERRVFELGSGVHTVSNGAIGVHWPKTTRLRQRFEQWVSDGDGSDEGRLLDLLLDDAQPPDSALPDTGVGLALERMLAPVFIRGDSYGTRAGTLVLRHADGRILLRERRFGPAGRFDGDTRWAGAVGQGFASVAADAAADPG